jgi:hypothetical protein
MSLWQDASHCLSREQVNNTDGSTIQVAKLSFQIFSTRLSVTFESDIVKDSPKSSVLARDHQDPLQTVSAHFPKYADLQGGRHG